MAQEAYRAQIFKDADATGFEEDASLTAMWLWTLNAGSPALEQTTDDNADAEESDADEPGDDEAASTAKAKGSGYVLEYDAARKIAQGPMPISNSLPA